MCMFINFLLLKNVMMYSRLVYIKSRCTALRFWITALPGQVILLIYASSLPILYAMHLLSSSSLAPYLQ